MGNLFTMQSKLPNRVFSLDEAINIFGQVIRGVEAIHRLNIVHRDIKPENIFVRKTDKNALVCKIGDFGLARFLEVSANSNCGTQNYMAPEILEQVPYGKEVDVWSLGVLLYYLLFGDFPFKGNPLSTQASTSLTTSCPSATEASSSTSTRLNRASAAKRKRPYSTICLQGLSSLNHGSASALQT